MKQRFLTILMFLFLAIIAPLRVYAAETLNLSVSEQNAQPGEEVSVTISVANNTGLSSLKFDVTYDNVLTLTKVTFNSEFGSMTTAPEPFKNPEPLTMISPLADIKANGVFATLTFKVADNVEYGYKANVTISYNADDIYDGDYNNVPVNVTNGSITIVCPHTNKTNTPEVPADCDETGFTAGVYCEDCKTYLSGHTVIPATGVHVDVNGKWETDGTNHYHTCDCGEKFDVGTHTGGTANCKNKAVCSVCNTAYGNVNSSKHDHTEVRNASSASCNTDGYTGDTYCTDCGVKTATGSTIPATGAHVDANGKWESDGTNHYHTCACGTKFDTAAHTGGTANCKNKAVCSVCNTSYGNVNSSKHDHTEVRNASSASCNTDGYTGDTYCTDCGVKTATSSKIPATGAHVDANGKWESDGTNHFHTCDCGEVIDTAAHKGGNATCKDKAKCSVCGTAYGEIDSSNHVSTEVRDAVKPTCTKDGYTGDTYCKDCNVKLTTGTVVLATGEHVDADDKWESDRTNHFHTCGCGTTFDSAAHSGGNANCTDKAQCEVCGTAYGELEASKHKETEVRDVVEATCNKEGYRGDTYCKSCGVKTETGSATPATGVHTYGEWVTTKEPTTEETGTKEQTCTVCGHVVEEVVPVLEPAPTNNVLPIIIGVAGVVVCGGVVGFVCFKRKMRLTKDVK